MLKIRLSRTGKKRQPSYRVVVANVTSKRDGRVVEQIGFYNPLVDPIEYRIDEGRALHWLSVGAQPSDAVERLLVKQGTVERLGRLRAGEELNVLVAEFSGVAPVNVVEAVAIAEIIAEEEVLEEIDEAIVAEIIEEEIIEEIEAAVIVEEIAEEIEAAVIVEEIAEEIEAEVIEEEIAEEIEAEVIEEEIAEEIEAEVIEEEIAEAIEEESEE